MKTAMGAFAIGGIISLLDPESISARLRKNFGKGKAGRT